MILDLLLVVLLIFAIIKGYRRGFIVAIFSFIAVLIGLAAAVKLSAVMAGYLGDVVNVSQKWLPFLSFIVVFLLIVLLIRLVANLIQASVEAVMMGWANRLGGIILYVALYILVYSIVLFYAEQLHLLNPGSQKDSISYTYVAPLGPPVIEAIGVVLPFFKNMFSELKDFFGGVVDKVPPAETTPPQ